MILWLRSDADLDGDASGLTWQDQVTHQDAVADDPPGPGSSTVPTVVADAAPFGHRAVVRFDGKDDRVRLPAVDATFEAGFTAAIVLRTLGKSWYDGVLFFGSEAAGETFTDAIAIGRENDWDRLRYTVQSSYDPSAWWAGIVQMAAGITALPERAEIVVVVQQPDNASVWSYLNGKPVAKAWGDAALPGPAFRDASFLGWLPGGAFKGDVAEVIVYARAVDDVERGAVEAYLSAKYDVPLAQPCTAGCPEVLATKQALASPLALSGSRVVWTNSEGGEVMAIEDVTAASPVAVQIAGGPSSVVHPTSPALDASHVYWGDEGHIHRVPVAGGADVSALAAGPVQNVALDGDTLYASMSETLAIAVAAKSAWPQTTTLPMDGKVGHVATDGSHLYWSQLSDAGVNGVFRAPKGAIVPAGAGAEQLGVGWSPTNIAVDDAYAYFELSAQVSFGLLRVDKLAPGAPTTLADESSSGCMFPSGSYVYFASSSEGSVKRVPRAGGAITTIATGQTSPWSVVVAGGWVVWSNLDGTVVRMPAPP